MKILALVLAITGLAGGCIEPSPTRPSLLLPNGHPQVDIKANGSDAPVTVKGSPFTYSWKSSDTTECEMISPRIFTVSLSGSAVVNQTDPIYPKTKQSIAFTIHCQNGDGNWVADTVLVHR